MKKLDYIKIPIPRYTTTKKKGRKKNERKDKKV